MGTLRFTHPTDKPNNTHEAVGWVKEQRDVPIRWVNQNFLFLCVPLHIPEMLVVDTGFTFRPGLEAPVCPQILSGLFAHAGFNDGADTAGVRFD